MSHFLTIPLTNTRSINYQIRPSKRAKHLKLTLSTHKGLEVVKPINMKIAQQDIHTWVLSKTDWIIKSLDKLNTPLPETPESPTLTLPDALHLKAIDQHLQLQYHSALAGETRYQFDLNQPETTLSITADLDNTAGCIIALQKWTQHYSHQHLGNRLLELSRRHKLPFRDFRIKNQKTCWGSCSGLKNINLNYKLIFFPPSWVQYTLIHELCHTVEANHSAQFWALVESHMPEYRPIHQAMKQAHQHLPDWVLWSAK